jgi:hypothetical protein
MNRPFSIFFGLLSLLTFSSFAQSETSPRLETHSMPALDSASGSANSEIEVYKLTSDRTFTIKVGRTVWIPCQNEKGKTKIKKAKLVAINGHQMVFIPNNKNFKPVDYLDTELDFIAITTGGRVAIGLITNAIIIVGVTVVYVFLEIATKSQGNGPSYSDLLIPLRKNLHLYPNGKWGLRIVDSAMPIAGLR